MQVVAHRGLHTSAPENSLASIEAAIKAGVASVEVDVRRGGNGELYLLHDTTLDRTTSGAGRLSRATAADLRRARLSDGAPLPLLREAVDLARGRIRLCLDVKEPQQDWLREICPDIGGDLWVWSSRREVVAAASANGFPALAICSGLLADGPGAFLWRAGLDGASAVSFYPADVEAHVAAACRNAGMRFFSGTPNDRATWDELLSTGADGIITDRPEELRSYLDHLRGAAPRPPDKRATAPSDRVLIASGTPVRKPGNRP